MSREVDENSVLGDLGSRSTEREDFAALGRGAESNPSVDQVGDMDMRAFLRQMTRLMKCAEPSSGNCGNGDRNELNRQIAALAPHKDGIDIVKYIKKLEADLTDIGCPRVRFKTVLLQKLQSKSGTACVASVDREHTSYPELKELLVETLGSSRTALGVKLISDFGTATKSMNSTESYAHLKGLIDSVDMATVDKADVLLFLAIAVYRASRPASQRTLMDARDIGTFKDLNRVALSFQMAEPEPSVVTSVGVPSSSGFRGMRCFVCQKLLLLVDLRSYSWVPPDRNGSQI